MPVTLEIKGIDRLLTALSSLPSSVTSGVKVIGEVNYIKAMVWDLGYVTRTIKPGPKTMWSVNVYGQPKVLTIIAPTGFIRIHRQEYAQILRDEFSKADFPHADIEDWPKLIQGMMANAAERAAHIVAEAAPIETGELRASIVAAPPNDPAIGVNAQGTYSWAEPTFDIGEWLLE